MTRIATYHVLKLYGDDDAQSVAARTVDEALALLHADPNGADGERIVCSARCRASDASAARLRAGDAWTMSCRLSSAWRFHVEGQTGAGAQAIRSRLLS